MDRGSGGERIRGRGVALGGFARRRVGRLLKAVALAVHRYGVFPRRLTSASDAVKHAFLYITAAVVYRDGLCVRSPLKFTVGGLPGLI